MKEKDEDDKDDIINDKKNEIIANEKEKENNIVNENENENEKENEEESEEDKDEENNDENNEDNNEENNEQNNIEEITGMKLESLKTEEEKEDNKANEADSKKENKKLITSFEYKNFISEELNHNIIYSEDKNNINFISLDLLISKINDNTLEITNKNLIYMDILLFLVYQKNALMTNEVFFNIIELLIKSNNINTGLYILNNYLINYYSTEISPSKEITNTVVNLYKLTKKQVIIFKLLYDEDIKIEINELIEYIIGGKKDKINTLGGMEIIRDTNEQKETIIPEITDPIFDVFSWDPVEIARQITIISQYLYRNIGCQELVLAGWTKKDKMEKSPNITKLIIRFNKISKWIMEEILSYDSSKDRAKVIELFLCVAEELRKIHNLNDCFAVITTFNHLCIKRLKKTWKQVTQNSKNKQKELSKLCSILKNFEAIKNEFLQYKNSINDINDLKEGCIPYLAPYLKDLAFLEEGHKYFNENKLINIHKLLVVGKNIKNIKESQIFVYTYKPVYSLTFLSDPEPLDDNELTTLSESLEPKFKLNTRKSKIKRKTNTEVKLENNKLSKLFLEYVKDYGFALQTKMTLKERIRKFQTEYTPIGQIQNSNNSINRSFNMSSSMDSMNISNTSINN